MRPFVFEAHIPRTIFGQGTLKQVAAEIERLNCKRVLLITQDNERQLALAHQVRDIIGEANVAGICADAVMHTPEEVTTKALAYAQSIKADGLVSLGGGSTVGLAKALAVRTGWPHVAVPTTYAGSEATPVLGETVNGLKTTRSDPKILPNTIVYDVDLTLSMPAFLTFPSGINALAHCVEALYSATINPIIEGVGLSGISQLWRALLKIKDVPEDVDARADALGGAWAAGVCLAHVGMGLHHKLCHTLGGSFGLPHAETHTVVLPHAMGYNYSAAKDAMGKIEHAIGTSEKAPQAFWDFEKKLGTPTSLKELGLKKEDLAKAADIASKAQYPNPAPLDREKLLRLLENAWEGNPPEIM
ncbi:hypothetical protein Q8F55_003391 [Vanrija albida]|uniref:Alcohol dehydrogenase iron-type/glycerol dehydrogenase GldA domain-containing protein n=1 Tax=Vanrija albida TaxID=181172 RepID=A0ABR3Q420_9TREE